MMVVLILILIVRPSLVAMWHSFTRPVALSLSNLTWRCPALPMTSIFTPSFDCHEVHVATY